MPAPPPIALPMSPEWTTLLQTGTHCGHGGCHHAEILRDGILMCRVTVVGTTATPETATQTLETRARAWIAGFELRRPAGRTTAVPSDAFP
jgi:hypothetical protein